MKERPILFSTPMVQAILEGKKTQTRRIVKGTALEWLNDGFLPEFVADPANSLLNRYGVVGDLLWVRETFWYVDFAGEENNGYVYKASENGMAWANNEEEWKWKPSIFMPKEAARIWLEITNVRVERLNEISEEEAIAEGVSRAKDDGYWVNYAGHIYDGALAMSPRASFKTLWQSINGKESWNENPWVWVIEFKKINSEQGVKVSDTTGDEEGDEASPEQNSKNSENHNPELPSITKSNISIEEAEREHNIQSGLENLEL